MAKQRGKEFEEAVHAFVKALDPSGRTEVIFDHKVLDRDTGTLRQVDVWVNTTFAGIAPISILISCKDYKRNLHNGDIDKFTAEVRATSASTGIIYARRGFAPTAIAKARKHGLSCCRLYKNQPADLPPTLAFESYLNQPQVGFIVKLAKGCDALTTWGDLFAHRVPAGDERPTLMEVIEQVYAELEVASVDQRSGSFPPALQMPFVASGEAEFSLTVQLKWRRYKARKEAHLIDGSYCLTDGSFRGTQTTPQVDRRSVDPGPGWVEISADEEADLKPPLIMVILRKPDLRASLEPLLEQPIPPESREC